MLWSLSLSLLIVSATTASSTSNSLSRRMFADPGVDPKLLAAWHNISCVGQRFDLQLPPQTDWNPNEVSVHHLCAKTKYGGGPAQQNIGGWCDHGEVVFDYQESAQINQQLSIPRVQLGCRYRCFCSHNIPDEQLSIQPKASEHQVALQVGSTQSSHTNEIALDILDDFTTTPWVKKGRRGTLSVPSLRLSNVMESEVYVDLFSARYQYVSQDPGNSIRCSGPLPTFTLLAPFNTSDFGTLQEMCAVQLDGGLFGANAGGFCYRSDATTASSITRTVWFSDEMTPRLEWTWTGGQFFAAASIRMHCARYCRCSTNNSTTTTTTTNTTYLDGLWEFIAGAHLAQRPSGQIDLLLSSTNDAAAAAGAGAPMTILPAQNGPNSPSGTCGADRKQFCPQKWPTELLGPVPRAPPNATDVVRPAAAAVAPNPDDRSNAYHSINDNSSDKKNNQNLTTCGNTCRGPLDCSASDDEKACVCAFPTAEDSRTLGLDPVVPAAVCLVLMHASFGGKGGLIGRGGGGVMGRDCLCNGSFVHEACCGSQDGMVWLK